MRDKKKEEEVCPFWIELDNEIGQLFEYCRKYNKKVICCATKKNCKYR